MLKNTNNNDRAIDIVRLLKYLAAAAAACDQHFQAIGTRYFFDK